MQEIKEDKVKKMLQEPEMRLKVLDITLMSYSNDPTYTASRVKIMKEMAQIKKTNPELFV